MDHGPGQPRRTLLFAGLAGALAAAAVALALYLGLRPPHEPPLPVAAAPDAAATAPPLVTPGGDATRPAAAAAPEEAEAVVAAVAGKVERLRGNDWAKVAVGDRVKAEDSLRTGARGRADLEIGSRSRLTVAEDTQVSVAELTAAVHRFKIRRGRVAAAYQADGERVLRIERESGDQAVETRAAAFSVRATDSTFAVATETGAVNLRAAGKAVDVAAGQLSVATAGQAPSPAAPIPTEVLLKVAAAARTNPCARAEGFAPPGAEVLVGGRPVAVDASGRFEVKVDDKDLREVRVEVRDVQGHVRQEKLVCSRRPGKPGEGSINEIDIRWQE